MGMSFIPRSSLNVPVLNEAIPGDVPGLHQTGDAVLAKVTAVAEEPGEPLLRTDYGEGSGRNVDGRPVVQLAPCPAPGMRQLEADFKIGCIADLERPVETLPSRHQHLWFATAGTHPQQRCRRGAAHRPAPSRGTVAQVFRHRCPLRLLLDTREARAATGSANAPILVGEAGHPRRDRLRTGRTDKRSSCDFSGRVIILHEDFTNPGRLAQMSLYRGSGPAKHRVASLETGRDDSRRLQPWSVRGLPVFNTTEAAASDHWPAGCEGVRRPS